MHEIPIPKGTDVQGIVGQMDLVASKPEHNTNTLPVHWSGYFVIEDPQEQQEFMDFFNDVAGNMALWKDEQNRFVLAWVELENN